MLLISHSDLFGSEDSRQRVKGSQSTLHRYTAQGIRVVLRQHSLHHLLFLVLGPKVVLLRGQELVFSSSRQAVTVVQRISPKMTHQQSLLLCTFLM
jgi:hypothetical protein